jgi:hypothetical protein
MQVKKHLHPDAETPAGGNGAGKANQTAIIPTADTDFKDVAKNVANTWLKNPDITLIWKKAPDFQKQVADYETALTSRKATGSLRPGQSQTLDQLDKQLDAAVTEVKVYIQKKFKKNFAQAQFARYGIVKEGSTYRLSKDRNNRLEALKLMITGIAADGFDNEEYGKTFWATMQTNYAAALDAANNTSGDVSGKVATKNEQKKAIRKVLSSLLMVIKGNYPDTFESVYRNWGWRKESY